MSITEFLLARIAEDEQVARRADETRVHVDPDLATETWVCHDLGTHVGLSPHRVLAESEAKRQIAASALERGHILGKREEFSHDLRVLASLYANHPDYDEAWRP